ncbi:uncharacterized protein LOC105443482 [Strongylocentrotus purpuratus]|uniref:Uncharacterized protein n=1 Tax=Strongylocentrotus purpuratus TaxID=7668 RepID=A0A7M7P2X9_STRPU|nr:uncharacterized protein LOC105443482 [Strongylocentrotus purpuratus]
MKLFFVPLLLISMVVGTWAIDCYTCDNWACDDPFFPFLSFFSRASQNTCPKTFIPIRHCSKTVSGSGVRRSCAPVCIEGCFLGICTYCCKSNLCNGGTTVTTSFVAMGVAMLAAFILARQ